MCFAFLSIFTKCSIYTAAVVAGCERNRQISSWDDSDVTVQSRRCFHPPPPLKCSASGWFSERFNLVGVVNSQVLALICMWARVTTSGVTHRSMTLQGAKQKQPQFSRFVKLWRCRNESTLHGNTQTGLVWVSAADAAAGCRLSPEFSSYGCAWSLSGTLMDLTCCMQGPT